jgi:hypothetical protein
MNESMFWKLTYSLFGSWLIIFCLRLNLCFVWGLTHVFRVDNLNMIWKFTHFKYFFSFRYVFLFTRRQNSVWTMHGRVNRPAQTWPWKFPLQINIVRHDEKNNFAFTWIHVYMRRTINFVGTEALLLDIIHFDFLITLTVDIIVFEEKMGCIQMCKIR